MNEDNRPDAGFFIGLLAGTVVGAGIAMLFAPRAGSEVRQRVAGSAKEFSNRAAERYQQVSARVGVAVDDLSKKGQIVRDGVADAVAHGAGEVARHATGIKNAAEAKKQSANDR
jgi:gas vesicle protein